MKKYVTIDIGGTMIKYGLINEQIQFIDKQKQETQADKGGSAILQKVFTIIETYLIDNDLSGICLSSAGMVDPLKGEIFYSGKAIPNYAGTSFKQIIEQKYAIPCEIENDVNCAGLAEVISGNAQKSQVVLCLTIGTGIGGCLLLGSEIFHGCSNSACEVGYLSVGGTMFQELASTTALVERVADAYKQSVTEWNGQRIFLQAKKGDSICIEAIDSMVDYLAQGLATICYVMNPEMIVLGGGIMTQKAYLEEKINRALTKHLLSSLREKTTIVFAHHENDAGMLGAYYHFERQQGRRGKKND